MKQDILEHEAVQGVLDTDVIVDPGVQVFGHHRVDEGAGHRPRGDR